MDPDAAAASAMDSSDHAQQHANGDSHALMEVAATGTADAASSSSAAAAAVLPSAPTSGRSSSDESALECTLYKFDDKHHRRRNTVQPTLPQLKRAAGPAPAGADSAALGDALAADPPLTFTSSSEWGSDEDENLRHSYFTHTEMMPITVDGKSKTSIFVCLLCSQRYKKAGNFVTHVQTHEVTAAAMLAELQQQAAQQTAASVQQAETDEDAPRFFVSAMQVVVQYSCKLCQPHITLYEKLSELHRHILVEHLSKTAPALLTSHPQHRSSTRVPVLRSLGGSNSDEENGAGGGEEDDDSPPVAHSRIKHTPSRFSKNNNTSASNGHGNGRKRKSIASTFAGPDEDGCAVAHGVVCSDCSMVFPSKNEAYRKHRQGHLRFKSESSLAQQHMTDQQRAAHEVAHPEQQQSAAGAAAAGGRPLPSKPLTRAQLAAISKRSDDDEEKADKDDSSDGSQRMKRNPLSSSSLVTQQLSPPELRVSCGGCLRIFSRRSALNRHIRLGTCRSAAVANGKNGRSEDDSSIGSDGEYQDIDPNLYYCKFCPHVAKSRTAYYTHRKKCSRNPEVNGASAAAEEAASASSGIDQLLAATGEQMQDADEPVKVSSKPPLHRQHSAEKSENGSKQLNRPAMQRAQTEPAAHSRAPKGADRFDAKDLICPVCSETFTHPFSVNRHMSVHPAEGSKGTIYTCKHCKARFGHSQRFHKHESNCASRVHGNGGNGHAAAASSKNLDEPEAVHRTKRPRNAASSSADTSSRVQSSSNSSAAAAAARSSSDLMLNDESSAVQQANGVNSRSSSLEVHAASRLESNEPPSFTAAAHQQFNLQPSMSQTPLLAHMLSSFPPPPPLSAAPTESPWTAPAAASTVQPFSFAPMHPTSQIGSFNSHAFGGSQANGFATLPLFPPPMMQQSQPMQTQQPASMSATTSDLDSSAFSLCVQGIGLRASGAPSASASLCAPVSCSASAASPASMEVAMAAASNPQSGLDTDRSLTSGSFSPATTAFNLSKRQAASAPGKRAASMGKKPRAEVTHADQSAPSATASLKPNPAASMASASTVPASASAASNVSSTITPATSASAATSAPGACPMCSASLSGLALSDERAHRQKCMEKLVRLAISQRTDAQKRLIDQHRERIKQIKAAEKKEAAATAAEAAAAAQPKLQVTPSTPSVYPPSTPLQAAGSEVPASASASLHQPQLQLPQSWCVTPTPSVPPPKFTATLHASARPSLAAPTPANAATASVAPAQSATTELAKLAQPPLPKLPRPALSLEVQNGTGATLQTNPLVWTAKVKPQEPPLRAAAREARHQHP